MSSSKKYKGPEGQSVFTLPKNWQDWKNWAAQQTDNEVTYKKMLKDIGYLDAENVSPYDIHKMIESKYLISTDSKEQMALDIPTQIHSQNLEEEQMSQALLQSLLDHRRGQDGLAKGYSDLNSTYLETKRALKAYKKANVLPKGKKYRFMDGSVGYGKYRRVRKGRGRYVIPGILGAAKQLGKNIFGLGRYRHRRGYGAYGDGVVTQDIPIFANPASDDGPVTVRNKEFITNIHGSDIFHIQHYLPINPGNEKTFPWLSKIASNFSQYRFEGLSFHFVSTSGNITVTQALGNLTMAVDYDPAGKSITTKQQMLTGPFSVSKAPCTDSECPVECAPQQMMNGGLLYVRNERPDADLRFFDLGEFVIATEGQNTVAVGKVLGELWVTYQVALYKPQQASMEEGGDGSTATGEYRYIHNPNAPHPWGQLYNENLLCCDEQQQASQVLIVRPQAGSWTTDALEIQNCAIGGVYELAWYCIGITPTTTLNNLDVEIRLIDSNGATTAEKVLEYPNGPAPSSTTYPFLTAQALQIPNPGGATAEVFFTASYRALTTTVYLSFQAAMDLPTGSTWGMVAIEKTK